MASSLTTFDPWIGDRYARNGLHGRRILVLGEAHYGRPEEETAGFTRECIDGMALVSRGHAFFTKIAKMLLGVVDARPLTLEEKEQVWSSVAFFNYIPGFPGEKSRIRPG